MPDTVTQPQAVTALLALISGDYPVCSWIVFGDGTGLEGWIVEQDDPEFDRLEAIQIWAKLFGTGVNKVGKVLITSGTKHHVPIRILVKDVYS